ncbi:MAG: AGE family epimerase/isomerase [Myxococcota bacterium]
MLHRSIALAAALIGTGGALGCGAESVSNGTGGPAPIEGDVGDDTYSFVEAPQLDTLPSSLQVDTWKSHLVDDLMPYWLMEYARGEPVGNFPTYRNMRGEPTANSARRPRMLSRQTYAYAMGYALTGDEQMLALAQAGAEWLMTHAPDEANGGYHAVLDASGEGASSECKTAQDAAYVMLGVGAYYFITRDPEAEAFILEGRDLLFDPDVYWDAENERIRDAVAHDDLSTEIDVNGSCSPDGGWELVAQLDPINAFMLLTQPVLSTAERRAQFLSDLRTLSQTMVDDFFEDGIFWGLHNVRERGTRHVDFGHSLKAYWMVLQIDKRLEDHPFHDLLMAPIPDDSLGRSNLERAVQLAYGDGRWRHSPRRGGGANGNPDWWIYAEADQIAATLSLAGGVYVAPESGPDLGRTAGNWITDFVDPDGFGEVIPGIRADGSPVYDWPVGDTAKCNQWKNGYHSIEHAMVMTAISSYLSGEAFELYFAFPEDLVDSATLKPYFFQGKVADRTEMGAIAGSSLSKVRASFVDLF